MNHDAMNDSARSSNDYFSTTDEKRAEDSRKPFVKPELRREADLVDGTKSTYSLAADSDES